MELFLRKFFRQLGAMLTLVVFLLTFLSNSITVYAAEGDPVVQGIQPAIQYDDEVFLSMLNTANITTEANGYIENAQDSQIKIDIASIESKGDTMALATLVSDIQISGDYKFYLWNNVEKTQVIANGTVFTVLPAMMIDKESLPVDTLDEVVTLTETFPEQWSSEDVLTLQVLRAQGGVSVDQTWTKNVTENQIAFTIGTNLEAGEYIVEVLNANQDIIGVAIFEVPTVLEAAELEVNENDNIIDVYFAGLDPIDTSDWVAELYNGEVNPIATATNFIIEQDVDETRVKIAFAENILYGNYQLKIWQEAEKINEVVLPNTGSFTTIAMLDAEDDIISTPTDGKTIKVLHDERVMWNNQDDLSVIIYYNDQETVLDTTVDEDNNINVVLPAISVGTYDYDVIKNFELENEVILGYGNLSVVDGLSGTIDSPYEGASKVVVSVQPIEQVNMAQFEVTLYNDQDTVQNIIGDINVVPGTNRIEIELTAPIIYGTYRLEINNNGADVNLVNNGEFTTIPVVDAELNYVEDNVEVSIYSSDRTTWTSTDTLNIVIENDVGQNVFDQVVVPNEFNNFLVTLESPQIGEYSFSVVKNRSQNEVILGIGEFVIQEEQPVNYEAKIISVFEDKNIIAVEFNQGIVLNFQNMYAKLYSVNGVEENLIATTGAPQFIEDEGALEFTTENPIVYGNYRVEIFKDANTEATIEGDGYFTTEPYAAVFGGTLTQPTHGQEIQILPNDNTTWNKDIDTNVSVLIDGEGIGTIMLSASFETDNSIAVTLNNELPVGMYDIEIVRDLDQYTEQILAYSQFEVIQNENQPFGNAHILEGTYGISEQPEIDVIIDGFSGELNLLNLKIMYQSEGTAGDPQVIATLTNPVLVPDETNIYRFSAPEVITVLADPNLNHQNVQLMLDYDGIESYLGGTQVINMMEDPWVNFEGIQSDLYTVKVEFSNEIDNAQDILSNLDDYINVVDEEQNPVIPTDADLYSRDQDGRYQGVILYFSSLESGSSIMINGISDKFGHTITEYVDQIHIDIRVYGVLTDENGDPVQNAGIQLIDIDELNEVLLKEPIDSEAIFESVRNMQTDEDGVFENYFEEGNYKVLKAYVGDKESGYSMNIDEMLVLDYANAEGGQIEFNIQLDANNVSGQVADAEGYENIVIVKNDYLTGNFQNLDQWAIIDVFANIVTADEGGAFALSLKPGTYSVIGKFEALNIVPVVDSDNPANGAYQKSFTVTEGQPANIGQIYFPVSNVFGTVLDHNSNPVSGVIVGIKEVDAEDANIYLASTDVDGTFDVALPLGDYIVSKVFKNLEKGSTGSGKYYDLRNENITFTVDDLYINQIGNITLPQPNVTLLLEASGETYDTEAFLEMSIVRNQTEDMAWISTTTGQVDMYLTSGSVCNIERLDSPNLWMDDVGDFAIEAGHTYTGENAIVIDVFAQQVANSNAIITFANANDEPIVGIGVQISGKLTPYHEWAMTNNQGQIYLDLEPGVYKIQGYEQNKNWVELNQEFTVTEEHVAGEALEVTVEVAEPNVKGIVKDESGNPIIDGYINIKKLASGTELFDSYLGARVDGNGRFELILKDGTYVVEGVGTNTNWYELGVKFVVASGVAEPLGDATIITDPNTQEEILLIQKPADNFSGHLYEKAGVPFKGNTGKDWYQGDGTWIDVGLILIETGISDEELQTQSWKYQKYINVDEDGVFGARLDSSKTYEIVGVVDAGRWIEVDSSTLPENLQEITFTQLPINLEIVMPAPNFSGVVKDFDGNEIDLTDKNMFINLEKADYTEWVSINVEADGSFGKSLKVGEDYNIREIVIRPNSTQAFDDSNETRYEFNKKVTIGEATTNRTLKPNAKVILDTANMIDSEAGDKVWVVFAKVLDQADQNYADMQTNPWKYEARLQGKIGENGMAECIGYIEEGNTYKIRGISFENGWKELNEVININQTTNGIVVYDNGKYTITLSYEPNVCGVIKDSEGNPINEAWVNIQKQAADGEVIDYSKLYFGTNTDSNGEFRLKLEDGDYTLVGYSTSGQLNGTTWIPGKWTEVRHDFTIDNGKLVDEEGQEIPKDENGNNLVIQTNISGIVERYNKATEEYEPLANAWLRIQPVIEGESMEDMWQNTIWTNTDALGEFGLTLGEGDYKVVEAGAYNVNMKLDLAFTVAANSTLVPSANVIDGKLVVRPITPNLTGVMYKDANKQQLARYSWMVIKPSDAKENEWENAIWLNTNGDGEFETFIDEGEYKIVEFGGQNFYNRVKLPITVDENGDLSSTIVGLVNENGEVIVAPQAVNLTGYVKNANGQVYQGKTWLTIKPAASTQNDWTGAIWVESKLKNNEYVFETYLEPNDYKVVQVGSKDFYYDTEITFTIAPNGTLVTTGNSNITNGKLMVGTLPANVTGTAYGTISNVEQAVAKGWIGFARYNGNGEQITMEGETIPAGNVNQNSFDDIRWEYIRWAETNADGVFSLRLPVGANIKVVNVGGNGIWYKTNQSFVVGTSSTNMEVREPAPNTTIVVKNAQDTTSINAWIDVMMMKGTEKIFVPFKLESKNGTDYVFKANLTNGDYKVKSFGTPNMWTELEKDFTVGNDVVYVEVNFATNTSKKVIGSIVSGADAVEGWIAIKPLTAQNQVDEASEEKWIQANAEGEFEFKLEAGSKWVVVAVTDFNGHHEVANPLDYAYTVTADAEQEAAVWNVDIAELE
ncbi:MAG: hypothetical protein A2Y24_06230 [Clostridiales bacterium GWE2_32_10]|nr:MAG: hypothetical protein A2Y24_06230 [Clostridiales bacterium GWE2_32_10]